MGLEGQVAIVTGAGLGIGKAIAVRLAVEGADVFIIDVNGQKAQATRGEIRGMGRRALAVMADLANFRAVEARESVAREPSAAGLRFPQRSVTGPASGRRYRFSRARVRWRASVVRLQDEPATSWMPSRYC